MAVDRDYRSAEIVLLRRVAPMRHNGYPLFSPKYSKYEIISDIVLR